MRVRQNKYSGFSMVELMIALAIAAILIGVGIPSFESFMANSKMAATNNAMVYSVQIARSTAMERLVPVGLCKSDDPLNDVPTCNNAASYNDGWFVYADDNPTNGTRDPNEDILHRVEAPGPAFAFTVDAVYENQVYFNDSGASINVAGVPVSGTMIINYSGGEEVRFLTVSANGRVSTTDTP